MKTYSEYIWLKRQLAEMQEVLSQNIDSPLMRASLEKRIASLQSELDSIGSVEYFDTSLKLWFGGEAVYGSMGIFSDFASKTSVILSNMIATKYTEIVSGKLSQSERGKIKGIGKGKMYISNILHGSFGYEMGWVGNNLFSEQDASQAIEEVISLIDIAAKDEERLENILQSESPRTITYLRNFYKTVSETSNILKMESGMNHTELSKTELQTGYSRIKQSNIKETYLTMEARLSGIFTDSGTFEFIDDQGHRKTGNTTEDLDDEQLTEYARLYTNQMCKLIMKEYRETPSHGKPKAPTYELLQIQDINN